VGRVSVLKVDTDRYEEAAGLEDAAGRGIADAVAAASSTLERTAGMAGWDAMGSGWAASYDPAAREVLDACRELALASSDTSRALSMAAGNYVEAEHVASMGLSALIIPFMPAALPETYGSALPSAADGSPGWPPPCWDIVAGIAGVVWPAGDPDVLRTAGTTWTRLASDLEAGITGPSTSARDTVQGLLSRDLTVFRERSTATRDYGYQIAQASRDIAGGCVSLADAIGTAHEELIDETRSFAAECALLAGVGIALGFVTLGGSAAITSLVGAARAAQMVARVHEVLSRLVVVARSVAVIATRLPGAGRLTAGLHSLSKASAALSSRTQPARQALSSVSGHNAFSDQRSRLAPAIRIVRPLGAVGIKVLDSTAVSVALSNPARLALDLLPLAARGTALRSVVMKGSASDQIFAMLRNKGLGTSPLISALEAAIRTKDRVGTATEMAALPTTIRARYAPRRITSQSLADSGPGRLTAARGSPANDPTVAPTRVPRTSHPATSQ
jgi:hypothetical protein